MNLEILKVIAILIYFPAAWWANDYVKYHIMGIRAEFFGSISDHYISKLIWAVLLGWASIPIAILHSVLTSSNSNNNG